MPKGLGGIELHRGGRCLDVACGLGEQSLWAAQQGFDVVALDASEVAITALNSAACQPRTARPDRHPRRSISTTACRPIWRVRARW